MRPPCVYDALGAAPPLERQMSEDIYSPKHLRWEAKDDEEADAATAFKHGVAAIAAAPLPLPPPPPPPPHIQPTLVQRMAQFRVGGVASHTLAISCSSDDSDAEEGSPTADGLAGGGGGGSCPLQRPEIPGLGGHCSSLTPPAAGRTRGRVTAGCGGSERGRSSDAAWNLAPLPAGASARRAALFTGGTPRRALAAAAAVAAAADGAPAHDLMAGAGPSATAMKAPWFSRLFLRSHSHPQQQQQQQCPRSSLLLAPAGASSSPPWQPRAHDVRAYAPPGPRAARAPTPAIPAVVAATAAAFPSLPPPPPCAEASDPWRMHAEASPQLLAAVTTGAAELSGAAADLDGPAADPDTAAVFAHAPPPRGLLASCLVAMGCARGSPCT